MSEKGGTVRVQHSHSSPAGVQPTRQPSCRRNTRLLGGHSTTCAQLIPRADAAALSPEWTYAAAAGYQTPRRLIPRLSGCA